MALLLTGCAKEQDAKPRGEESAEVDLLDDEVDYVALGDSFTSGPGIAETRADPTAGPCFRSIDNYPAFLADWLEVDSYTDVSCGGATTDNVLMPQGTLQRVTVPPQVDGLSESTDLVTISLGANDLLVYSNLVKCADIQYFCLFDELDRMTGEISPRVAGVLEQVALRAPRARIVVVGYPQILPPTEGCDYVSTTPEALARLDEVMAGLNASLAQAAEDAGATYIDLQTPSRDHHVCAGEDAWIVGEHNADGEGAYFHPNVSGMRGAAVAVFEALTDEKAPLSEAPELEDGVVVRNPDLLPG